LRDIYKFGLSHPEDGSINLLWNIGKYLAVNMTQHSRRLEKSSVLLLEPMLITNGEKVPTTPKLFKTKQCEQKKEVPVHAIKAYMER
jgi:methionine aminopeptidase